MHGKYLNNKIEIYDEKTMVDRMDNVARGNHAKSFENAELQRHEDNTINLEKNGDCDNEA